MQSFNIITVLQNRTIRLVSKFNFNLAVKLKYYQYCRKWISEPDNLISLNDKIIWLLTNTDLSEWTRLADKVKMRDFVKQKGLEEYLPKLLGTWKKADDIDLALLPDKFVLKCNHDCGSTCVVDKNSLSNWVDIKRFLKKKVNKPFGARTFEKHYLGIPRLILAEEYIENDSSISSTLVDYKFWCFNGVPRYCLVCLDRQEVHHINKDFYQVDNGWIRRAELLTDAPQTPLLAQPPHLQVMLHICKRLSVGFAQVRIDLYESNGKVYIGELTFSSACGRMYYFTEECLLELGKHVIV